MYHIKLLKNKIKDVHKNHQRKNWDGYGAEPMKYLEQSLKFAETLSGESKHLIDSVDIVPENDGCLCFEWFKTYDKYIDISVQDATLIFTYKVGDDEGCGEMSFSGKQRLLDIVKKVVD